MIQSKTNPDGVPLAVIDQLRQGTAANRAQFYQDFTMPFYGFNRPGAKISQGIRDNWWRYPGFPHGMPATEAATINADLLAFVKG